MDLNDPISVLLGVHDALDRAGIRAATYGGLALAVYGEARETKDADLAVSGLDPSRALAALQAAGIEAVQAFERVRFGGNVVSRLTLTGGDGTLNMADFVEPRSERYAEVALDRAIEAELRGQSFLLLAPEDFVVFKVLSTRDHDLEDARTVLRLLGSRLDLDLVEAEVRVLVEEVPDYEVADRWSRVRPDS